MAVNNIKIFDQNKANMLSDEAYNSNTQRINGVQQGIASSQLQNKTLYQVSLVAYAIGQMMQANGLDANDADAVSTFANNMSQTIMQKVLDKANSDEAIAGTNNTKFITPSTLKAAVGSYTGRNLKNNDFRSYTTVLEAANAAAPGGTFFATNAPDPLYNAPDRPWNLSQEFQYLVLCDADNARKTVLAFNFNETAGTYWYSRRIWQGKWKDSTWKQNGESLTTVGIAANGDFAQRRFIMSPQTPIAYCPILADMNISDMYAYMLPNQEANVLFSDDRIRIQNIASGVIYDTQHNAHGVVIGYDNDSCIYYSSNNAYTTYAYRYSSTSAAVYVTEGKSGSQYAGLVCAQSAFSASDRLIGICGSNGNVNDVHVAVLNKGNNTLSFTSFSTDNYYGSKVYDTLLFRASESKFVFMRYRYNEYSGASYVYTIDKTGALYSSHGYSAERYHLTFHMILGCINERICLSNGSDDFNVCDIDGGFATSQIRSYLFNLPTGALGGFAHYSGWDGADGWPGADSFAGAGLTANWDLRSTGSPVELYESYNARVLLRVDNTLSNYPNIAVRASAVPYSMFFL